jgi:hypothetical protein
MRRLFRPDEGLMFRNLSRRMLVIIGAVITVAIIGGITTGLLLTGSGSSKPWVPVSQTYAPVTPQPAPTPTVCSQPDGLVWKIQDQLGNAQTPRGDGHIWKELTTAAWPPGFVAAAMQMAHDIDYTDGPAVGVSWDTPWPPGMDGSPASTSQFIARDDATLSSLCP